MKKRSVSEMVNNYFLQVLNSFNQDVSILVKYSFRGGNGVYTPKTSWLHSESCKPERTGFKTTTSVGGMSLISKE